MSKITVISKLTHKETVTDGAQVTLSDASIVKIHAGRADIVSYERVSNDLVIRLNDGETITLKNFYVSGAQGNSQLVLEEDNGALWWIADPIAAEQYQSIASIDALLAGTTTASAGDTAVWPWVVGGLAVAGGIGLAAGGGGGGGGGGGSSDDGGTTPPGTTPPVTNPNDTVPPDAPTNLRFSANGAQLSGNAEANSVITIKDANGNVVGSGKTNANGEFTVDLGTPYTNGQTLTATATDGAGNVGQGSSVTAADTTPPAAPVIASVVDDIGSVTGSLTSGQTTDDPRPAFSGSGEPGATVTIYDNGVAIGSALVNNDGNWAFTPGSNLSEGAHQITTRATDSAGNTGPVSPAFSLTIDTVAPNAPSGVTVTDSTGALQGTLVAGQTTDANRPGLSGTGEAGSTITIYDNGQRVGETTVGADGKWSFTPANPLQEGSHAITLTETDRAGNTSSSSAPFEFTVDRTPPEQPTIELNATGSEITGRAEPGSAITITNNLGATLGTGKADDNGDFKITLDPAQTDGQTISVIASDSAGNASTPATTQAADVTPPAMPADLVVAAGGASVSGSAEAGSHITITDADGKLLGEGDVGPEGKFTIAISPAQLNGEVLTVIATDAADNVSPPGLAEAADITSPNQPTDLKITDDGAIVTGKAEAGSTVIIRDGDDIIGKGVANPDGSFEIILTTPRLNGEELAVTATDKADNTGPAGEVIAPDTTPPDAPIITRVVDDVQGFTGDIGNGKVTNDTHPVIHGTGEPGATIYIFSGTDQVGFAEVDLNGNWSTELLLTVDSGYVLTAVAVDRYDNRSEPSNSWTMVAGRTAPP